MRILPLIPLALLAACTVGPDYDGPPKAVSDASGRFVRAQDPAFQPGPGLARWWEGLNDPTLTALIDDALAHSPTIAAAEAKIGVARAKLGQQRATGLPSVSASATFLHAELPGVDLGSGSSNSGGSGSSLSSLNFYNLGMTGIVGARPVGRRPARGRAGARHDRPALRRSRPTRR